MTHSSAPVRLPGITAALALAACLAIPGQPVAAEGEQHKMAPAADVTFGAGPPHLPPGAGLAVMSGNPGEAGLYVLRLKFPAGYDIPPHIHPQDELVTVISGALGVAMGDMLDRDAAPMLSAGSFVDLPANTAHYAWAEEVTVVQVAGMGPFAITYVQDGDDPRIN